MFPGVFVLRSAVQLLLAQGRTVNFSIVGTEKGLGSDPDMTLGHIRRNEDSQAGNKHEKPRGIVQTFISSMAHGISLKEIKTNATHKEHGFIFLRNLLFIIMRSEAGHQEGIVIVFSDFH